MPLSGAWLLDFAEVSEVLQPQMMFYIMDNLAIVCTAFGLRCSARVPPVMEPATQFISDKDYALNCSYITPPVTTNLMIGMIIFMST